MKKTHLFAIDVQNDFCSPNGALFVTGADSDAARLSALVGRVGRRINGIHVTLDSHQELDVAHACFWVNSSGNHPSPFTAISKADVESGVWTPTIISLRQRMIDYVTSLENSKNKYPLLIWPTHCVIASWGTQLVPAFSDAIRKWARDSVRTIDYCVKGTNPLTEHYSIFKAEVSDPSDPGTMLNTRLIQTLQSVDELWIAGEALSHCVKGSIEDLIEAGGEDLAKKCVFIEDCSSSVPGFEAAGQAFVKDMKAKGMRFVKSTDL